MIILSGDRHLGDISRLHNPGIGYPLYELTASGMNSARGGPAEPNRYRVIADNVREDYFGSVRIDQGSAPSRIHLDLRDIEGRVLAEVLLPIPESSE